MGKERQLYLLRHCQSTLSQGHYCLGHTDVPLSDLGRERAHELQKMFAEVSISAIFASDLLRSRETAEIIGMDLGLGVKLRTDLREIKMGQWDGLTFEEIKMRFPVAYRKRGEDMAHYQVPGGESFSECAERATGALREIMMASQGDVLVVTHAGFMRAFRWALDSGERDIATEPQVDYGFVERVIYSNDLNTCRILV